MKYKNINLDVYIDCNTGDRYQFSYLASLKSYTGEGNIFKNDTGLYMEGKFEGGMFKQGNL